MVTYNLKISHSARCVSAANAVCKACQFAIHRQNSVGLPFHNRLLYSVACIRKDIVGQQKITPVFVLEE
jgi:hypothetical protein